MWVCTRFGGLSWGCRLHCLIGLYLNTQFKAKVTEKFQDGTGCMVKQAVLLEFSFWIFFLHPWDSSIFHRKQFLLCAKLGEKWLYQYFLLPARDSFLMFLFKGDFLYFGKDSLMIFWCGFRFTLGLDVGVLKLHWSKIHEKIVDKYWMQIKNQDDPW